MHLKLLKLAGFKSFVEPTVVPFSSQLVAVVGPNGCGKSNIIDAVRWVMGESSAKNLRGESMADVIFNGSSTRKSIGQASVELVFDNNLGRLAGQYASYQEISVKRLVTRDGDSFYYLNGSRCRRRDITDIFLGTGAGARGYSIIGQDTISRLIEARPDDLRAYLEEAAGVSKYKERRRETLQRINHTRENLARVADIRDELGKQLLRLERQAKSAERYKALKQEERLCKADILALKWRELATEQTRANTQLSKLSLQLEHHRSNIACFIKGNAHLQEKLRSAQDSFQQTQVKFYQLNTEIARLEETIQQQEREKQRLMLDEQQIQADLKTATSQLLQDSEALDVCKQALDVLRVNIQALQKALYQQQQIRDETEQQKINWDIQWQQVQTVFNQAQREAHVEHVNLQHIEQRYQQMQLRLEKNQDEQLQINLDSLQIELATLQEQHIGIAQQEQMDAEHHQREMEKGVALRQQVSVMEQQLHQAHDKVKALVTEHASLLAAQHAALRTVENMPSSLPEWEHQPRLAEMLHVPDQWMRAFELVLGESLQAIVLDSMDMLWPTLADLHGRSAVFVQQGQLPSARAEFPRLSDKVSGFIPCWLHALDQIFAAETLAEALTWLPQLTKDQSVVTAEGCWLGPGWVRVYGVTKHDETGILHRQRALAKISVALGIEQENLSTLQATRDQIHSELIENERQNNVFKNSLSISLEALRACSTQINHKQQALEHALLRKSAMHDEFDTLQLDIETLATQKIHTERLQQAAIEAVSQHEQHQQQLMVEKASWNDGLISARRSVDASRDSLHHAEIHCNKETLKIQQLSDNINREQRQIDTLHERLKLLHSRCKEFDTPGRAESITLQEKVAAHRQLDAELSKLRQEVDGLQHQLSQQELGSKTEEYQASLVQEKIQQERLLEQEFAVRAGHLVESLTALNANVDSLLAIIPAQVTVLIREQDAISLDEKIKRLGAINLIAIEEYQTELERKQHLDDQYRDLMDALATLETAIVKMDKETECRLKDTFDQVNEAFQSLFPRLFGGGRAQLELTCDNLLEAGIVVQAQPPGKRNSTIHLLSGGEKAMTAVALVFAIFQLNPSPFCMLDEVDAPLDDLNVRRFCNLVKEMSQFVQFLFITHNKITMEMADHLIGVTMREPGVSRLVTVDVGAVVSTLE